MLKPMKSETQARESLRQLVAHVFKNRNRAVTPTITYARLAHKINRHNKHGAPAARGMGQVLGKMGQLLRGIEGRWGERVPHIQGIVVQKTGRCRGLPDDGIKEFWPDYPKLSLAEKEDRVQIEQQRVGEFGSRWNDILRRLDLKPIAVSTDVRAAPRGGTGESAEHKELKEYIRSHPEIVGAKPDWIAISEYPLPSGDVIDVLFRSKTECVAVEVKSIISDGCPKDYERGIFQTVKYRALLEAAARALYRDVPSRIRSILVLQSALPSEYRALAKTLRVELLENVMSDVVRPRKARLAGLDDAAVASGGQARFD